MREGFYFIFYFFFGLSSCKISHKKHNSLTRPGWWLLQQQPEMEVITLHAAPFSFILLGTRLRFQLLLIPSSRDTLRPGPDPSSPEATAVLTVKNCPLQALPYTCSQRRLLGAVWYGEVRTDLGLWWPEKLSQGDSEGCKPSLQWPPPRHSFFQHCCRLPLTLCEAAAADPAPLPDCGRRAGAGAAATALCSTMLGPAWSRSQVPASATALLGAPWASQLSPHTSCLCKAQKQDRRELYAKKDEEHLLFLEFGSC